MSAEKPIYTEYSKKRQVEGLARAINANGKDAVEAAEGMADDINSVMNDLAKDMETSIPTDFSLDAVPPMH